MVIHPSLGLMSYLKRFLSISKNVRYLAIHGTSFSIREVKELLNEFDTQIIFLKSIHDVNQLDVLFTNESNFVLKTGIKSSQRQPKGTLVMVENEDFEEFKNRMGKMKLNMNIYAIVCNHSEREVDLFELISLSGRSKVIANKVEIGPHGPLEKLSYLQGLHLHSITGDWWPWTIVKNCKESSTKDCQLEGCLVDMFSEAKRIMNFTWSADVTKNWGSIPENSSDLTNYKGS